MRCDSSEAKTFVGKGQQNGARLGAVYEPLH